MTTKCFACKRLGDVPSNQRRYVGLFGYEDAMDLARTYAAWDGAPVELIRDEGSGRIKRKILTVHPNRVTNA